MTTIDDRSTSPQRPQEPKRSRRRRGGGGEPKAGTARTVLPDGAAKASRAKPRKAPKRTTQHESPVDSSTTPARSTSTSSAPRADEADVGGKDQGPARRRWWQVGPLRAPVEFDYEVEPTTALGPVVRQNRRRAERGWYAPLTDPAPTTTRQGEILNPAVIAAPLDDIGVAIGRDLLSSAPVAHDPFTAYQKKAISSPGVIVLGVIGSGKSSLVKTVYVLRPLILHGRRAVVLDRKDEGGAGEYTAVTQQLGSTPFTMRIGGGGIRLNPLDPRITDVIGADGQFRLLASMAARANDGELEKWERKALRVAHVRGLRHAEVDHARVPVMQDVTRCLGVVDGIDEWGDYSAQAKERMHQAGLGVRHLLDGLLADELAGMFDGPTSPSVELSSKLTTFDISQLPQDGPATAMVLAVVHAWVLGTLRRDRGNGTNFVIEEGWDMVTGPIAKHMNANQMLARGLGLSNIAAMHHPAQVKEGSEAESLLKEPQTVHIYRQDRTVDVEACVRMFNLDPSSAEVLRDLKVGCHLMKVGNRPEMHVQHERSQLEVQLTDTDSAMEMRMLAQ